MAEPQRCRDCGIHEGQLHVLGCDNERCPFCAGQLISCDCVYTQLDLFDQRYGPATHYLPPDLYHKGLTEAQAKAWEQMLEAKGRLPYIVYPVLCARCGTLWPEMFAVPDEEWQHYIQLDQRESVLCHPCYLDITRLIDLGTRKETPS